MPPNCGTRWFSAISVNAAWVDGATIGFLTLSHSRTRVLNCVLDVICLAFLFAFRQAQTRTLRAAMPIEIYPLEA